MKEQNDNLNLKHCPFCKSTDIGIIASDFGKTSSTKLANPIWYSAVCGKCGAQGGIRDTIENAAYAWNMRADEDSDCTDSL